MTQKHIYVLLRNKIIGIDSIIPLCMQLHKECNFRFTFLLFHDESYAVIKNDNIVLFDAMNIIGEFVSLSSHRYKYKIISKVVALFEIVKIIFNTSFNNSYVMHSGALHVKPLNFIVKFLPIKRIIFHEKSPYGLEHTYFKRKSLYNNAPERPESLYQSRQTQDIFDKHNIGGQPVLYAGILIGYDKLWNYFKHAKAISAKQIVFNDSRNASAWVDFVTNSSPDYIDKELEDNNLSANINKHIIVVFVGRLQLDQSGKFVESFIQMINQISTIVGDKLPIFIKPHIFSDLVFIEKCISEGIGSNKMNYIFTRLHPSVLASRAVIAFFANHSTVINEISNLKVPVIQYLYDFDEYLDDFGSNGISLFKSEKADYFFTKETRGLNNIINKLISVDSFPAVYRKREGKIDCDW
jgi:hypothetical protein